MVTFKGTVKEASTLSINGLSIFKMGGQFEYEIKLNSKMEQLFLSEASNGAETSQVNRTIFYEKATRIQKRKKRQEKK